MVDRSHCGRGVPGSSGKACSGVKVQDLRGEARQLYQQWRALGYTEEGASDRVDRSGLVQEPKLYEVFRGLGLSREAASTAALGRDPHRPTDDLGRIKAALRELGLSEAAPKAATADLADPRSRPVAETAGRSAAATMAAHVQDNRRRLIESIERIAYDIRKGGSTLCLWDGETRERASLRAAYYEALEVAEDDATKMWVIKVVDSCWPGIDEPVRASLQRSMSKSRAAKRSASKRVRPIGS
jgi:hypothetical protein